METINYNFNNTIKTITEDSNQNHNSNNLNDFKHSYLYLLKETINEENGLYLIVKTKNGEKYFVFDPSESEENRLQLTNSLGIYFTEKSEYYDSSPVIPKHKINFRVKNYTVISEYGKTYPIAEIINSCKIFNISNNRIQNFIDSPKPSRRSSNIQSSDSSSIRPTKQGTSLQKKRCHKCPKFSYKKRLKYFWHLNLGYSCRADETYIKISS